MSELNDERGYQFNSTVAAVLKRDGRIVEPRKRTFGSLKMPRELGDLDVLVIEPAKHRVAVIECKDLALARTPQELASQLEGLTESTEHSQGAAMVRHARRLGARKSFRRSCSFRSRRHRRLGGPRHVRSGRTAVRHPPARYRDGGSVAGISTRESRGLRPNTGSVTSSVQPSPRDRSPLLVIDAQDQESLRMTLIIDPERRHAPTPHDSTRAES
jgi:hypothetical protein